MTLPSGVITQQERGTVNIFDIAKRIAAVASVAYEHKSYRDQYKRLDRGALTADVSFHSVLSNVDDYRPQTGYRIRAYLSDIKTMMTAIEEAAYPWLQRELAYQLHYLKELHIELFSNIQQVHLAAQEYVKLRDELPQTEHKKFRAQGEGDITLETVKSINEREQQARTQIHSQWIDVLFNHPKRYLLFYQLARSEDMAIVTLEEAFLEAHKGIEEFGKEIKESPDHIWRYPPIVAGTLMDIGIVKENDRLLLRFMLDIAQLRSKDEWQELYFIAGIAIAAFSLFMGPGGMIILSLADIVLGTHSGWREFERQQENDYALTAQAFAQGMPLTDRTSDYGPFALQVAAALLSAFQLPRMIKDLRLARAAEQQVLRETEQSLKAESKEIISSELRGIAKEDKNLPPIIDDEKRGLTKPNSEDRATKVEEYPQATPKADAQTTTSKGTKGRGGRSQKAKGNLPDVRDQFSFREYIEGDISVKEASGFLGVPGEVQTYRDISAQARVSSNMGDDAGHLIGNRFGPPGDERNLSLQNWQSNRFGTFRDLEDYWAMKLHEGTRIEVRVRDFTRKGDVRPYYRKVEWTEIATDETRIKDELIFGNFETSKSRTARQVQPTVDGSEPASVIDIKRQSDSRF